MLRLRLFGRFLELLVLVFRQELLTHGQRLLHLLNLFFRLCNLVEADVGLQLLLFQNGTYTDICSISAFISFSFSRRTKNLLPSSSLCLDELLFLT